jgi:quercetin dioxygenase-like cupin family protein
VASDLANEAITARERREVVLLTARDEVTMTWSRYAPGERGPDLHVHREHTDAFYVLDGELTFAVGPAAERIRVPAGGFVAVPPNVVHSFLNDGGADARWLNMHAPDKGFAAYMRAMRDGVDAGFDSFDPPADGGLPSGGVIVTGPGEGERLASGTLKAALAELCVAEWDGPPPDLPRQVAARYELAGRRVLTVHAPDDGVSDFLRGTR